MSKERKALGRGFSALLGPAQDISPLEAASVKQVEIELIALNPWQPRTHFDLEKLEELAQSIRAKGVIQPVLVRKRAGAPGEYELIAGERRLRASKLAGFDKIPAVVKEFTDQEILEVALIENIQRADLNPLEESKAYKNLLDQHGYTQEDLAKRVGKSRSAIANQLRLLNLPEELQKDLEAGRLSQGHARSLLAVEDPKAQRGLAQEVMDKSLTVRELEQRVQSHKEGPKTKSKPAKSKLDKELEQSRLKLEDRLKTQVKIEPQGAGGQIQLVYANLDEFNRLFSLLNKA
ncbi:MAG: hypothetical protein A2600_07020 [Candidatus Lambdaproteobacteria bacterium RIFOXYD1_FULL_56_27]|uniref:HTH cro/C1-type domain-containing protein n=1 Tax=Candidatus Lambdaproteobacteria bacterium RIFOXYD2_FULL_56_26 TaxID=1817773 RepID=A0A1F6GQ66_9PROT|nr:MAG: hypothetical protein A2557_05680 [Candidatus Lambdaproteobacteria bacterium RIFOXYD2_FULL_56_26]OGH03682.1 MAG: hypothetical protein A2426_00470 [Candidatus Lambdaproteobacteria bacterium RIFOXYC1_FULL_56_13]OGH07266.1 MAG: hypothetical protein A2600_07020 [Candidatus Lambdaproteobacteria bacterium RIFOXYD1_FULL_56_27]